MNVHTLGPNLDRLRSSRQRARTEALLALRTLEGTVKRALAGESLRGLPNLMNEAAPFYAVRLNGPGPSTVLPPDGRWVPVLLRNGTMAFASRGQHATRWVSVTDEDFLIEDFKAYVAALNLALKVNEERTEKTAKNYEAVALLATRIREAIRF